MQRRAIRICTQAVVREDLWLARKQVIYWVVMVLAAVVLQALGLGRTYSDPAKEAQEQSQGLLGWLPLKPLFQVGFYFWVSCDSISGLLRSNGCNPTSLPSGRVCSIVCFGHQELRSNPTTYDGLWRRKQSPEF